MYGLPADFDASPFVGRELAQVWFQKFTMQFVFGEGSEDEIRVILGSSFAYQRSPDAAPAKQAVPVLSSSVTELIGRLVLKAVGTTDGTLTLNFEGEAMLQFFDDSRQYESYEILGMGTPIPVVRNGQQVGSQLRVIV